MGSEVSWEAQDYRHGWGRDGARVLKGMEDPTPPAPRRWIGPATLATSLWDAVTLRRLPESTRDHEPAALFAGPSDTATSHPLG
ncbi:MAG: hypothetical protein ACI9EF_003146 [Pseudohongiellaceae bacterium]|jgi:hypothetical protein